MSDKFDKMRDRLVDLTFKRIKYTKDLIEISARIESSDKNIIIDLAKSNIIEHKDDLQRLKEFEEISDSIRDDIEKKINEVNELEEELNKK